MKTAEEILNKHVTDGTGIEVTTEEAVAAMEEYANQFKQPPTDEELEDCETCGGDGKETCNNPDHGFIEALGGEIGRLGCPVCGHDENYKVPNGGKCEDCNGTGKIHARKMSNQHGIMHELIEWIDRCYPQGLSEQIIAKATELLNQSK